MNDLLCFSLIEKMTGGKWLVPPHDFEIQLSGGAFDTRSLGQAEIFFAWKGENSDGHQYLKQLEGSSVKLAIVEQAVPPLNGIAVLKVPQTLEALHQLAKHLAKGFKGKIVNITGSSGKTTTKTWLTHLLGDRFNLLSNPGSFNNHIGCPMTILSMNATHDLMILEMGSSGLGELDLLSSIAPADVTLLLNVGHAHLGKFGSIENTYQAKTEIFNHRRGEAVSIVPHGDPKLAHHMQNEPTYTFGRRSDEFSYRIQSVDAQSMSQTITFHTPLGEKSVVIRQLGNYVGELLSAILAVCFSLGLSWEEIEARLATLPQEKGRSTFFKGINGSLLLDDTYNANPESMINMLETICSVQVEQSIGVVGNLAELETDLSESAEFILSNMPERLTALFLSGESGKILTPLIQKRFPELKTEFVSSITEMIDRLKPLMNSRTVVGIKGSRSSHMERVIFGLMEKRFTCLLDRCSRLNRCDACDLFDIAQ